MKNKSPQPLTMEERIRLAEEGLDIYGQDARIFPPPIFVDKYGFPCNLGTTPTDWEEKLRKYTDRRKKIPREIIDYLGFAEARCPAPELSLYQKTKKLYKQT